MKIIHAHHAQCIEVLKERFGDNPIIGIEVGCGGGDSAAAFLAHLPNIQKIYTMDTWEHRDMAQYEAGEPQARHDAAKKMAYDRLSHFGERVEVMHMSSDKAFETIQDKVDFVWIDGDHTYGQVVLDIAHGLAAVKEGGLIGGHDYVQAPQVTQAVDEAFPDGITMGGDFTWWRKL